MIFLGMFSYVLFIVVNKSMKLDLHGLPIHEAWRIFNNKIADAYHMNFKYVVVVTGQGQIMREFDTWVSNNPTLNHVILHHIIQVVLKFS